MAIYGTSIAPNPQSVFPENAVDGQDAVRSEALLTPQLLTIRFLLGIPLVSQIKNPMTNKPDIWTEDVLKDYIVRAMAKVEVDIGVDILPVQRQEQHPYDRVHMEQYGYWRTRRKPILSIDAIRIRPANNVQGAPIWTVPPEWISLTHASKGQINLVPVMTATAELFTTISTSNGNGAAFLLSAIRQLPWAPSYWQLMYTSGFPEGKIPVYINELIGTRAALDILSALAATFRVSSYSLGLDGMSQSQSGPGPQVYKVRIDELKEQYGIMTKKVKAMYGVKLAVSQI